MKYKPSLRPVPQAKRGEFNEKILYLIDNHLTDACQITGDDIYNLYTGDGGLHGLRRADFPNEAEYTRAKKEFEKGQFFTPPELCQLVAELLEPSPSALIADLTCGMGNFFNYMPTEGNLYGCELDSKAYKVAKHLYPDAHLEHADVRTYKPDVRFDYVVGNPPFNLRWWVEGGKSMASQLYYCRKAAECMKPLGLMALITPISFLSDSLTDKSAIAEVQKKFRFLGQIELPANAFQNVGVDHFATKLQFWQRRLADEDTTACPYRFEMDTVEHIRNVALPEAKQAMQSGKYSVQKELAAHWDQSGDFTYRVNAMLYQIACHPKLAEHHSACVEHVHRFLTEKQPDGMSYEEWEKRRLTKEKVIAHLKRTLAKQNARPPEDKIVLVKRDYGLVYKGYSAKVRKQMTDEMKTERPFYELAAAEEIVDCGTYRKLVERKQREYIRQNAPFATMRPDPEIARWLEDMCIWDSENEEEIRLNPAQKRDLNLMLQKRYGLLQWEQGCGKTLAGIAFARHKMQTTCARHTWVVSSAISIRNNWDPVLKSYGIPYVMVERLADFARIRAGDFIIMTLNKVCTYRKQIKRWMRLQSQKACLIFDESDEISSADSSRTKAVLACFRRCYAKLLTTGTSTRNNISEFAPQLELLYNNSINMLSWSRRIYHYDKETEALVGEENDYFGKPIPAYKKGYSLFARSHLPEKVTVFGLGKRTQDIFNADALRELLDKTVITRTFEEVVGKEIRRFHQELVHFTPDERAVYQLAMDEFYRIGRNYFASTGNSRKDAMMRLVQQIMLLLRISAAPNTMQEFTGDRCAKIDKVVSLVGRWKDEYVVIGVRHINILEAYKTALKEAYPDRELFIVTGKVSFAKRRQLRKALRESGNGIVLCTQQSLASSVNYEFVNKIIIPELHYNNPRMSQFYMRFIRYTSTEWKDIYYITYAGSIESNLMQMVMAKEKINLFMKGKNVDLDEIYDRFGVDYDLLSLLMTRETDEEGKLHIRWGQQKVA